MTGQPRPMLARAAGVAENRMEDDLFLVHPATAEITHLDPMAAGLWNALAEPATADDLTALFAAAFPDTDPETVAADVQRALAELRSAGLIVPL